MHAVISDSRLFAKSADGNIIFRRTCNQTRQKMLSNHTVTNHDYFLFYVHVQPQ